MAIHKKKFYSRLHLTFEYLVGEDNNMKEFQKTPSFPTVKKTGYKHKKGLFFLPIKVFI